MSSDLIFFGSRVLQKVVLVIDSLRKLLGFSLDLFQNLGAWCDAFDKPCLRNVKIGGSLQIGKNWERFRFRKVIHSEPRN